MEIRELRIDNYLSFILPENITQVKYLDALYDEGMIGHTLGADRGIEDFNHIPLTEEWLVKFGFIYVISFDEYRYKEETNWFNIQYDEIEGEKVFIFGKDGMSDINVKYVHQLQNLFFALTGEELSI